MLTQKHSEAVQALIHLEIARSALRDVLAWNQRALEERQKSGPILRDYLQHAANAARKAYVTTHESNRDA